MNIYSTVTTTVLAAAALAAALASVPAPAAAMALQPSLTVTNLDHEMVDHGGGHYTSYLGGNGVLSSGSTTAPTSFDLTCETDDAAETVLCSGVLRVSGVAAPLKLRSIAGSARYAISNGFSALHTVAWQHWFDAEFVDLIPPFDTGDDAGDGDDGDGGGGGWNPEDVVIGENWMTRDYGTTGGWTYIMDGVVMNALDW